MKALSKRFGGPFLIAAILLSPGLFADTAHVAEDAHIDLGNPDDNNGVVPNLVVSNIVERKSGERLTFVSYELPALPAGASLEQAFLRLFVGKVATPGEIDLYLVTEAWDEHGISGGTAPNFDVAPFATFAVSGDDEGHFISVDVTPEVMDWLDGVEPNHGFVLVGNPAMDVDVSFDSKENGQTGHQSELELVLGTATGGVDSDDIADDSITSDDIADNTVGSDDIADGSITSVDIADGTVTGADVADGTIGSADINTSQVQGRVSGSCAPGSSIRVIEESGQVSCEQDDDTFFYLDAEPNGGLHVNEIGDIGGIPQVHVGINTDGVTTFMIADHTIHSTDVDHTSIQLRVDQTCPPGSSIRAISPFGAVTCETDDDTDTTLDPDLFWQVDGNAGTSPIPGGSNFLGTTDDADLVLGVNGNQALRLAYYNEGGLETVNTVGGHSSNQVTAWGGTIGGGGFDSPGLSRPNEVAAPLGTIGGGAGNSMPALFGGIAGGGFIGGGFLNVVENQSATIGGGAENLAAGFESGIHGGYRNTAYSPQAFIGGGRSNGICDPDDFSPDDYPASSGRASVIAGGSGNGSCGSASFIGGGSANRAVGEDSAIIGGENNFASGGSSTVLGGYFNRAVGERSLAGGSASKANGFASVALGLWANADHRGAFVWGGGGDGTPTFPPDTVHSERDNQFRIRAHGGARFDVGDDAGTWPDGNQWVDIRTQALNTLGDNSGLFRLIDTSTGAYLSLGGGWVSSSDRNRKTDIRDVDANWILEQIAAMPIQSWRYKVEGEDTRHIGPMAQDFHAAFGLGGDPKGIMSVDADGVALAAIQALYRVTRELDARTRQLEQQQHRLDALETSLQALEARLDPFEDRRLVQAQVRLDSE